MRDWVDGEDPYDLVALSLGGHARVAVTDAMPALHLLPLADRLGAVPVLAAGVLAGLRIVKDDSEIAALRAAGAAYRPGTRADCRSSSARVAPSPRWLQTSPKPLWPRDIRRRRSSSSVPGPTVPTRTTSVRAAR